MLAWPKGHAALCSTPVVVPTPSRRRSDGKAAYRLSANGYAAKPVAQDGLRNLRRMLDLCWLLLFELPGVFVLRACDLGRLDGSVKPAEIADPMLPGATYLRR